jgi:hypothetical protein
MVRPGLELTRLQVRAKRLGGAGLGTGQFWFVGQRVNRMKTLGCVIAAAAGLLVSAPAMAQNFYANGGGYSNIWSSAQGTSNSYGSANAFGNSSSGSIANVGGQGTSRPGGFGGGGTTSAITTSNAGTVSNGNGYAQSQTSGYARGTVSGYGGRSR